MSRLIGLAIILVGVGFFLSIISKIICEATNSDYCFMNLEYFLMFFALSITLIGVDMMRDFK